MASHKSVNKSSHQPVEELHPLSFLKKLFVFLGLLFGGGYLVFRGMYTLNPVFPVYSAIFFLAEVVGYASLVRFAYTTFHLRKRTSPDLRTAPTVDVFITTLNEPAEMLLQTIFHCQKMDYPHETYVLDDGRRPEVAELAKQMGVKYISRPDNKDAKAGNLNHALKHTKGEIIAVFDADGIPRHDFLSRLLGYFDDPSVALVQVPQTFYNVDSFQHRKESASAQIWNEQSLYFDVMEPGMDYLESATSCGSGTLHRRSSMEKIGCFATGTVTEDMHTTFLLHAQNQKTVYHTEVLAYAVAPATILPYAIQRARWALGSVQLMRKEWVRLLGPSGLSFTQRILYLIPMYYLSALQKTLYYLAPFLFLVFKISPFDAPEWFIAPLFLNMFFSILAFKTLARGHGRVFTKEVFFLYNLWNYAKALALGLMPVNWRFRVTPKTHNAQMPLTSIFPSIAIASTSSICMVVALRELWSGSLAPVDVLNTCAASGFAIYNLLTACYAISMGTKRPFSNDAYSFFDYRPLRIETVDGKKFGGEGLGLATAISNRNLHFLHMKEFAAGSMLRFELDLPDCHLTLEAVVESCKVKKAGDRHSVYETNLRYAELPYASRIELIRYFFEDATPKVVATTSIREPGRKETTSNQRRSSRLPALIPVYVSGKQSSSQVLGLLVDLSEAGARLKLPEEFNNGQQLMVDIPWMGGVLQAEVIRCVRESGQKNPPCDVGIRFSTSIQISPQQRKEINALKSSAEDRIPA